MAQGPEITGLAAWIVLLLPYAVLAAAIVFAVWKRVHPATEAPRGAARGRYGAALSPRQAPAAGPAVEQEVKMRREGEAATGGLSGAVERAQAKGDESELADLHLALGREKLAAGRVEEAADQLRKSIRVASRIGKKETHAEARLELAEIARAEGDLTTACEHWQIARGLFTDVKHAKGRDKADTLMREHGCPTDWVLNDF